MHLYRIRLASNVCTCANYTEPICSSTYLTIYPSYKYCILYLSPSSSFPFLFPSCSLSPRNPWSLSPPIVQTEVGLTGRLSVKSYMVFVKVADPYHSWRERQYHEVPCIESVTHRCWQLHWHNIKVHRRRHRMHHVFFLLQLNHIEWTQVSCGTLL